MNTLNDWHPADIIAALHKKGTTLAAVSRAAGLSSSTLSNALSRPWPKGEILISKVIGVPPQTVWPSRYYDRQGNLVHRTARVTDKQCLRHELDGQD